MTWRSIADDPPPKDGHTAHWHGFRAGLNGDDPRTCPYEWHTREAKTWNVFHRAGCDLRAALPLPPPPEDKT